MTQQELNYNAGAQRRAEILTEINAHKISIDRNVFKKTDAEKKELSSIRLNFKHNGLIEWNERNRPGNNKTA